MVKKAYLYSKNNKIHKGYEDHSLLSIFSENLIVFWSYLKNRFHHIRQKQTTKRKEHQNILVTCSNARGVNLHQLGTGNNVCSQSTKKYSNITSRHL